MTNETDQNVSPRAISMTEYEAKLRSTVLIIPDDEAAHSIDVLLDCIHQLTPVILPPLSYARDYLGDAYPLYSNLTTKSDDLLTDTTISKALDCLRAAQEKMLAETDVSMDTFLSTILDVCNSASSLSDGRVSFVM